MTSTKPCDPLHSLIAAAADDSSLSNLVITSGEPEEEPLEIPSRSSLRLVEDPRLVPDSPTLPRESCLIPLPLPPYIWPIDGFPSFLIFDQTPALLTPFGYPSTSPPVHFISTTSQGIAISERHETQWNCDASREHQEPPKLLLTGCNMLGRYSASPLSPSAQDSLTKTVEHPTRSLFVIPESPSTSGNASPFDKGMDSESVPGLLYLPSKPFAVDCIHLRSDAFTVEISTSPVRTGPTNIDLLPQLPPIQNLKIRSVKSRATPGLLRNLPVFSIPSTPPFGQSPIILTPGICSPLKSPFLVRRKSEDSTLTTISSITRPSKEDSGYFKARAVA
ncbi:hypothetical protein L218DRAFT_1072220 [Marasmius fiardii PR-910]|nr:hypothetical protein L218DRAFT_1072220 [Marasmius fiardii PR-910]